MSKKITKKIEKKMDSLFEEFIHNTKPENLNEESVEKCLGLILSLNHYSNESAKVMEKMLLQNVLAAYMDGETNSHLAYLALETINLDLD